VKQILTFFAVFALCSLLFAQDLHKAPTDVQEISLKETEQRTEQLDFISLEENTNLLELKAQRVRNHRYIVVSAVMMMLFAGLSMTSVSTINPE